MVAPYTVANATSERGFGSPSLTLAWRPLSCGYNNHVETCARSSADRALASGARGQRFESSRAYHTITSKACSVARGVSTLVRVGRVVCCTYASRPVIAEFAPPAPRHYGGQRGCPPRDPPLQRMPPTPRRPAQAAPTPSPFGQGVQEGYAWSFAGTAKSTHFSARSAPCVISLAANTDDEALPDRESLTVKWERQFLSLRIPRIPLDPLGTRSCSLASSTDTIDSSPPDAVAPAVPAIDTHTSVIAHSTAWTGDLESTGSLHVHGRVEGSLTARETSSSRRRRTSTRHSRRQRHHCRQCPGHGELPGALRGAAAGPSGWRHPRTRMVIHEGAVVAGEIVDDPLARRPRPPCPRPRRVARGGD